MPLQAALDFVVGLEVLRPDFPEAEHLSLLLRELHDEGALAIVLHVRGMMAALTGVRLKDLKQRLAPGPPCRAIPLTPVSLISFVVSPRPGIGIVELAVFFYFMFYIIFDIIFDILYYIFYFLFSILFSILFPISFYFVFYFLFCFLLSFIIIL